MDSLEAIQEWIKTTDNAENAVNFSEIPQICKDEPCMLGVDEAGRGPVLGPMVYGIAFCPVSQIEVLKYLGCADSKTLTEEARDNIFTKMLSDEKSTTVVGWATEIISPRIISNCMYRRSKCSLNEVSMDSAISLIKIAIEKGVNISEVYVDTVGPPEKYQEKLLKIFPDFKITVAKKADSIYPVVSAASIAAKVTRDHAIKVWNFREGLDITHKEFGSGYPADPLTKKFISERIDPIFGYPGLVRFSWSTAETVLQDKAVTCTFEDVEDDGKSKKTKKISNFFAAEGKKKRKLCKFFEERCLSFDDAFE